MYIITFITKVAPAIIKLASYLDDIRDAVQAAEKEFPEGSDGAKKLAWVREQLDKSVRLRDKVKALARHQRLHHVANAQVVPEGAVMVSDQDIDVVERKPKSPITRQRMSEASRRRQATQPGQGSHRDWRPLRQHEGSV